ncbi:hypothetical protein [Streptomyces hawaiiensis]|uniref:hypothetical protein n=1 Tax=Streptomyces hawaiiensis TaxID=67305 RepID=UPI003652B301
MLSSSRAFRSWRSGVIPVSEESVFLDEEAPYAKKIDDDLEQLSGWLDGLTAAELDTLVTKASPKQGLGECRRHPPAATRGLLVRRPADDGLCFSTNRSVLAVASKGFPPKGETQSLLDNSSVWTSPTGLSITAHVGSHAQTGRISASCAGVKVAGYEDVRVGDTVEIANVLFQVSELSDDDVRIKRTSA